MDKFKEIYENLLNESNMRTDVSRFKYKLTYDDILSKKYKNPFIKNVLTFKKIPLKISYEIYFIWTGFEIHMNSADWEYEYMGTRYKGNVFLHYDYMRDILTSINRNEPFLPYIEKYIKSEVNRDIKREIAKNEDAPDQRMDSEKSFDDL